MTSPSGEIYRVDWLPGTDILHGTCHCGAEHTAQDPIEMWEWMLAHPEGHTPAGHTPEGHASQGRASQRHAPQGHAPQGHRS
ncbi:hypothetical protein GCM10011579_025000 [Streptomyces albiflavescens]|uniref:Uncharacterized protein n=1 Tax=Streptomyces albiflavescens TaxID=1623582 RepID=A0A917XZK0_9ACTN|nr:hypothetical protein [Streptomyces albiflavescens]GGN60149.1 hypothetical protein GCM10011579_025000 [Streptomyces albiflavescens]